MSRRHHASISALAGGVLLLLTGCIVEQPVIVPQPPAAPAARVEVAPAAPGPAHVWIPGHWAWRDRRHGYVWIPGRYEIPAQPRVVWVPGHWAQRPGGWVWIEGHWQAR